MSRVILFAFIALLPQWLMAQGIQALPDFSAHYSVTLNGLQAGQLERSLLTQKDGSRHFSSSTQAKGIFAFFKPDLVEENSIFQLKDNKIIPLSYLYQRTGGRKEKYLSLSFDWDKQHVHIDDKKHPWTLKNLETNTLDKLVYQLALMSDLANGSTEFNYQIADGGKIKTYKIDTLDTEVITTPLGKIKAIKLIRLRNKDNGRQTILWCAPDLNYLPVKLEHTEKGGARFTAVLKRLTGIDTESAFTPRPQSKRSPLGIK